MSSGEKPPILILFFYIVRVYNMTVSFEVKEITEGELYTDKDGVQAKILKCYVRDIYFSLNVIYKCLDTGQTWNDSVQYFVNRFVNHCDTSQK